MQVANYENETDIRVHAEEAYAKGNIEGENKRARETALRMLESGRLTIEEIAEFAGLTITEVKELQETLQV